MVARASVDHMRTIGIMDTRNAPLRITLTTDIATLMASTIEATVSTAPGPMTFVLSGTDGDFSAASLRITNAAVIDLSSVMARMLTDIVPRRRSRVDTESVAPRLREVRLPTALTTARTVIAIIDARGDPRRRPDYGIGVWARLASPRHRLGARITGAREGLTAEIALARPPDIVYTVDELWKGGPVALVQAHDLIASEVISLAIRDLRTDRAAEQGGPWEDPLVQRATEIGLGIPGPRDLHVSVNVAANVDRMDTLRAIDQVERAVRRAGVRTAEWE
ncbi:MAG: hypothetical protein AB7G88_07195 [Thermomicrobiales bacterium]